MLTCKRCRGAVEHLLEGGMRAWICARCERVSIQITDWNVWKRVHRAVVGDRLDRPIYRHIPRKAYILRSPPDHGSEGRPDETQINNLQEGGDAPTPQD